MASVARVLPAPTVAVSAGLSRPNVSRLLRRASARGDGLHLRASAGGRSAPSDRPWSARAATGLVERHWSPVLRERQRQVLRDDLDGVDLVAFERQDGLVAQVEGRAVEGRLEERRHQEHAASRPAPSRRCRRRSRSCRPVEAVTSVALSRCVNPTSMRGGARPYWARSVAFSSTTRWISSDARLVMMAGHLGLVGLHLDRVDDAPRAAALPEHRRARPTRPSSRSSSILSASTVKTLLLLFGRLAGRRASS